MVLNSIGARRSATSVAMVLFVAGAVFGQDAPVVSPPLSMRPGTTLTVRINEPLSSDYSHPGDVFTATLAQPVVVLGIVVARYGQTVAGQVVEARKAGRVSGVSRLGLRLTSLTLVDGQTVPIQSALLVHDGPTSRGRDATAVAVATGLGAAIGGAVDGGQGAGIGAAVGAAAGTIGVLLTRGVPTVVDPETPLTFQVTAPVSIETNDAPQLFRFVTSADYVPAMTQPLPAYPVPLPYPTAAPYPYPYYVYYAPPYYAYNYPYFGYPYSYGASFSLFFGYPGYYHHHGYYGSPGHYRYAYAPRPVPYRAYAFHGGAHH
jgi:hypothetical protein